MSPEIRFSKTLISQVKEKKGIYSKLKESSNPIKIQSSISMIIKEAFYEYAIAHSCPRDRLELEWERFYKFLKDRL